MRARHRLLLWVALMLGVLLLVPWALPPARQPTYYAPPLSAGDRWAYAITSGSDGLAAPTASLLYANVTSVTTPSSTTPSHVTETFAPRGSIAQRWPLREVTWLADSGAWTSLNWSCGTDAAGTLNLTTSVAVGVQFPLEASGHASALESVSPSGCWSGAVDVAAGGAYSRTEPSGGISCVLYSCGIERQYSVNGSLAISQGTGPTTRFDFWGEYDPTRSALAWITADGPKGWVNLTLISYSSPECPIVPSLWYGVLQSAGLLLLVPAVGVTVEAVRFRRGLAREERERRAALLAGLDEEERAKYADSPPAAVDAMLGSDEEEPTSPGTPSPPSPPTSGR